MNRRTALVGGVAAVAVAAGAGVSLWRTREATPATSNAALWALRFERPGGGQLTLGALRGRPLLLNFWATWCPPCVAELPLLDRFQRAQPANGWQVVGLAVDNLAPVTAFLAERPVGFEIGLAGMDGIELARTLGNAGGALPFTAVFDRAGQLVQRKLGVIEPADLKRWVASMT
ncbi:MAG: TlpA disulfide reductase family protein [Pseudomonadota bacterium]